MSEKEGKKMATQLQPTPTLYGQDAQNVLDQVMNKPSRQKKEQLKKEYGELFKGIKKKGF